MIDSMTTRKKVKDPDELERITVRLQPASMRRLRRLLADRRMDRDAPYTVQAAVQQAIDDWMRAQS